MTTTSTTDIIDVLSGIAPGSVLDALRDDRTQARENAQRSFEALLEPADAGTFALGDRYAIALFVSRLLAFDVAGNFYADLLSDEAPELAQSIEDAASDARERGPVGTYREPGLAAENTPAREWQPSEGSFDPYIAAALAHAHLLTYRLRESSADDLAALVDAGWSADDIVTLSQLIAFLNFQLRYALGLQALRNSPDIVDGEGN